MGLRVDERIVAGGDGDALLVHHLVLRGSNGAIDRHLGELVRARYGAPPPGGDACLHERLRCSAAFVPARLAPSGHPLVSRTFELAGALDRPRRGEPPPAGRPYVIELHPDAGHASLAVCAFELEGAALDGVNAEGLVAAAAPDLSSPPRALAELHVVRLLLDRCATAAEAREVLRAAAPRGEGRPARWLVADRSGDAFVLEASAGHLVRIADAAGERLEVSSRLDEASLRTLWRGEYDAVERRLAARFFVGAGDLRGGEVPELSFQLA